MPRHKALLPEATPPEGASNAYEHFSIRKLHRSAVVNAPYNPRQIAPAARKSLRDNLERVGLLEPLIWNKRTGNLLSGHQRLDILDQLIGKPDYELTVSEVDLDPATEKIQNVFMNNPSAQGTFTMEGMSQLLPDPDFDFQLAGFTPYDWEMEFGYSPQAMLTKLGIAGDSEPADESAESGGSDDEAKSPDEPWDDPDTPEPDEAPPAAGLFTSKPAIDALRNTAEAMKARKKEYEETSSADPANDNEYYLLVSFDSREDKNQFLVHNGMRLDLRYVGCSDLLEMLKDEAKWR